MTDLLPYDISREWLDIRDDSVRICVIHTPKGMERPAIDAWAAVVAESFAAIPADQPALMLHNVKAEARLVPQYVRRHGQAIYATLAERRVFGAFVASDGMFNALLNALRAARPADVSHITERLFTETDAALAWLKAVKL